MGVTGWQRQEQRHQEDLQRLQGFRPIDDTFMRGLFKENIPLAEFVLRIITGKQDLILIKCETQADFKRVTGRGRFVWMLMQLTAQAKNMILRFKDQTMVLIHIVPGIIPVCWI